MANVWRSAIAKKAGHSEHLCAMSALLLHWSPVSFPPDLPRLVESALLRLLRLPVFPKYLAP